MTKLNISIDWTAALRTAQDGTGPDPLKTAFRIIEAGAEAVAITPMSGEGRIGYEEAAELAGALQGALIMKGVPTDAFVRLAGALRPSRITLVPDAGTMSPDGTGWDTKHNLGLLTELCTTFGTLGIRTAILVDPDIEMIRYASETGCGMIELDTTHYADGCDSEKYRISADEALGHNLGISAGKGLNLNNINSFCKLVPSVEEITLDNSFACDALNLGIVGSVAAYLDGISRV